MVPKTLIAGNWKMNGLPQDVRQIHNIRDGAAEAELNCDLLICPPSALIMQFSAHSGDQLNIGAQDCHMNVSGAHTGDHSAALLKASGATYVIVGHSERRSDHGESSEIVSQKALAAQEAGLIPIICVGETLQEREEGRAQDVVLQQVMDSTESVIGTNYVVAYEPVWAIGTGKTATPDDVAEMHAAIRSKLEAIDAKEGGNRPILYGGSMKPGNAKELLAVEDVNGGLIGGASLNAEDFLAIARSA